MCQIAFVIISNGPGNVYNTSNCNICKVKIPYAQRTCTLCISGDIEDEYNIVLICENFRDVRLKYIKLL